MFPLDTRVVPAVFTMEVTGDPDGGARAGRRLRRGAHARIGLGRHAKSGTLERHAFYERARDAFAIVRTGELRPYGNILLVKGVVNASMRAAHSQPPPMVVVFGSINLDLVARVDAHSAPGETLAGTSFAIVPGGKGANQALAARRAGAHGRDVRRRRAAMRSRRRALANLDRIAASTSPACGASTRRPASR